MYDTQTTTGHNHQRHANEFSFTETLFIFDLCVISSFAILNTKIIKHVHYRIFRVENYVF